MCLTTNVTLYVVILNFVFSQLCEPYYLSNNALVFASCLFYFPTTMFLMYREGVQHCFKTWANSQSQ